MGTCWRVWQGTMASSSALGGEEGVVSTSRAEKVKAIFSQFDKNDDGRLSKEEMASLVVAVNPSVRFSEEQIAAILDEVTKYTRALPTCPGNRPPQYITPLQQSITLLCALSTHVFTRSSAVGRAAKRVAAQA